jgi:hypothetical protein
VRDERSARSVSNPRAIGRQDDEERRVSSVGNARLPLFERGGSEGKLATAFGHRNGASRSRGHEHLNDTEEPSEREGDNGSHKNDGGSHGEQAERYLCQVVASHVFAKIPTFRAPYTRAICGATSATTSHSRSGARVGARATGTAPYGSIGGLTISRAHRRRSPVLQSHRVVDVPGLGVSMHLHTAMHPSYRLHVTERRGVIAEHELMRNAVGPQCPLDWPILTVALRGRESRALGRVRGCGREHWFARGDFTLVEDIATYRGRGEGDGVRALILQWDPSWFNARPPRAFSVGHFDARAMATVEATARALSAGVEDGTLGENLANLFELLRVHGILDTNVAGTDLVDNVPPALRALSQTVDGVFGTLHARPTAIDLTTAIERSPAHVGRLFSELAKRYRVTATGWREQVNAFRLTTGAMLMTSPIATTAAVARILGYSNSTALCRAFSHAGLPSPHRVRARVEALR